MTFFMTILHNRHVFKSEQSQPFLRDGKYFISDRNVGLKVTLGMRI